MKLLVLFFLIFSSALSIVLKNHLTRVESLRKRLIKSGKWENYYRNKMLRRMNLSSVNDPVMDYDDIGYLVNITIGTPGQLFSVIPDTGSAFFWIPDVTCGKSESEGGEGPCRDLFHKFDSNQSSTYEKIGKTFSIQYDSSDIKGFFGMDVFNLVGIMKTLSIPNTIFGQVVEINSDIFGTPIEGTFGLAFRDMTTSGITPPLINGINQHLFDKPLFSIHLEHKGIYSLMGAIGGSITYGDFDYDNCDSTVNYVPLSSTSYWQFKIDSISLGSTSSKGRWNVKSETATSSIMGPSRIVDKLAKEAGATYVEKFGYYSIDCNANFLDLKVSIGNNEYLVSKTNLIEELFFDSCIFAMNKLESNGFGAQWYFGDPFLVSYCHVYDVKKKQIGFSKPKKNKS
uniref:Peptidase A1 domain-containing protein n=1 Tax=Parastrongyloides trichosuri TaxID=131310 RepID=A0A0N4Z4G0_PARTI